MKKEKALKSKNKKLRLLWLILPIAVLIAVAVISVINSGYVYDPNGSENILSQGEKGSLLLYYDGADGKPESETIEYTAYEKIYLPELTKEGYKFSGWSCYGLFCGMELTLNSKTQMYAYPQFDKDYSAIKSPVALYTDEFVYDEYTVGEYPSVNKEIVDLYLDGGYKLIVYAEENFKGNEKVISYTGTYKGMVGSMKITEVHSDGMPVDELTDNKKTELLYTFAPRIWWAEGEEYYASTVENAAQNMNRVMSDRGYMYIIDDLDSPSYKNDYLYGSKTDCKAYAFAVEKEYKYLDLSYFVFTPYNKAKEVAGIEFGNHIGDWEHITVRLMRYEENGNTYYRPVVVDYSAHSFRNYTCWDDIDVVENTHPVAYTAKGSHGMWKDAGVHNYAGFAFVQLTDECSEGYAWDLWNENAMETYSYDALNHIGTGIGGCEWNTCFDYDNYDENSNNVALWGNRGWNSPVQIYPSLQGGPGGPQHKAVINDYYTLNDKRA